MNANDLRDLFASGRAYVACDGERLIDEATAREADAIATRATGLLAAAESNDGSTPETDALFASFFLPGAKTRPTEGDFDEVLKHARRLERERNALAARVRELEGDLVAVRLRYQWAANELLACDYGDNERGVIAWRVYGWRDAPNPGGRRIWGDSIDAAIDAARSK